MLYQPKWDGVKFVRSGLNGRLYHVLFGYILNCNFGTVFFEHLTSVRRSGVTSLGVVKDTLGSTICLCPTNVTDFIYRDTSFCCSEGLWVFVRSRVLPPGRGGDHSARQLGTGLFCDILGDYTYFGKEGL